MQRRWRDEIYREFSENKCYDDVFLSFAFPNGLKIQKGGYSILVQKESKASSTQEDFQVRK